MSKALARHSRSPGRHDQSKLGLLAAPSSALRDANGPKLGELSLLNDPISPTSEFPLASDGAIVTVEPLPIASEDWTTLIGREVGAIGDLRGAYAVKVANDSAAGF